MMKIFKGRKSRRQEKEKEKPENVQDGNNSDNKFSNSSTRLIAIGNNDDAGSNSIVIKKKVYASAQLPDLADEKSDVNEQNAAQLRTRYTSSAEASTEQKPNNKRQKDKKKQNGTVQEVGPVSTIRNNLPPDPLLSTPFGTRRMTYADYTASGRSLRFVEEYISRVVYPLYANTHTETSATGLQTTHFREEARSIILKSLHANTKRYSLIFTGSGSTGAIWKLIGLLGIHCPTQLQPHLDLEKVDRPLVLVSQCEHHSNELMWRETVANVIPIPNDETGSLDLDFLRNILEENKNKYKTIIGSFTAGSNVTGLTTKPWPVASLLHEYNGYICFDYAGAAPYKDMRMELFEEGHGDEPSSYLDAIYISPHKFVGGPGTPGLLCIRKEFANCRGGMDVPPTIAGGGTVTMVWPSDVKDVADSNRSYEKTLHVREEAGTPGIVESIRCGMAFYVRDLVGPKKIEELEGDFAQTAVRRMQAKHIWVMGDIFSNITSTDRLSITSFNVWAKIPGLGTTPSSQDVPRGTLAHPQTGRPLMLHFHFIAALLNDVYGIQARSGCACAGPLSFRLFGPRFPYMTKKAIDELNTLAEDDFHALKPGFCRVNFNYFIDKEEFNYIVSAIEQIAEHGWKLLPLYALCLKTGQYWYNGLVKETEGKHASFNRFDAVRRINEIQFQPDGSVAWNECRFSQEHRSKYLQEAMKIYDTAPDMVRTMLFRYRDLRRRDMSFPENLQEYRFFALGSEVLPHLGIGEDEVKAAAASASAKDDSKNPKILALPEHPTANPFFTMDRPRG